MLIRSIKPHVQLSQIVREYRIVSLMLSNDSSCKPYSPRAEQCLNFYPRSLEAVEDQSHKLISKGIGVALIGQQTELTHRYVHGDFLVITIVFRQGALYRLTRIPAHNIANKYLDAEMIFGTTIRFVNEQLFYANSYEKMIEIIETFLKQHLHKVEKFNRIDHSAEAMIVNDQLSLDEVADFSCLSMRQFRRMFAERIGVSPKLFAKIVRFEKATQSKSMYPDRDWLEIAISCGFTDYQHMSKDYRNFTGQSPLNFHILDQSAPERLIGQRCV